MKSATIFILAGLTLSSFFASPEDKIVFLDIGQGDAILLQSGSRQVLIDGGPGMAVLQRLAEEMPWFDRTIEVVILTHPQQDHMEGLIHVLNRYQVGMVMVPKVRSKSLLQEEWLNLIREQNIPYRFAWAGQSVKLADVQLQILGPQDTPLGQAAITSDVNNASVIARVDFTPASAAGLLLGRGAEAAERMALSLLLTGDAENKVEQLLVRTTAPATLDTAVMKAGHHGSKTSTSSTLLGAVTPSIVVISVGEGNRYGHPHAEVLKRLEGVAVYRTDEAGSVRLVRGNAGWYVTCRGSYPLLNWGKSCKKTDIQ